MNKLVWKEVNYADLGLFALAIDNWRNTIGNNADMKVILSEPFFLRALFPGVARKMKMGTIIAAEVNVDKVPIQAIIDYAKDDPRRAIHYLQYWANQDMNNIENDDELSTIIEKTTVVHQDQNDIYKMGYCIISNFDNRTNTTDLMVEWHNYQREYGIEVDQWIEWLTLTRISFTNNPSPQKSSMEKWFQWTGRAKNLIKIIQKRRLDERHPTIFLQLLYLANHCP